MVMQSNFRGLEHMPVMKRRVAIPYNVSRRRQGRLVPEDAEAAELDRWRCSDRLFCDAITPSAEVPKLERVKDLQPD